MSQPAPYKRTRVYIACTCLSDEYEQKPCERCVRKGLECVYVPVADVQDGYASPRSPASSPGASGPPPASYAYGSSPSPRPGNQGPPYAASPQSLPSMSQMPGAAFSTNPALGGSFAPTYPPQPPSGHAGTHYAPRQGYNPGPPPAQYNSPVASHPQPGSFVYHANYGYPSNWPEFSQPPLRSHAFALLDPAIAAGVEGDTLLETSINSQTITSKLDSFFENLLTVVKIGFYAPLISAFFELRDDVLKNAESSVHARYTVCRKRNNSAISSHANLKVVSP
ncbi:hypothetical protein C8F04DRAFT_1339667 [Mycena alexandri]|uniref:Uncharacterized protein n=1 Tax=Mycena alexandri TaxID=1745969 RepID=A0AAD6T0E9_9AGAR|nr:hypothetical protein C8F04DRAFT_1339667 [Mycena alexandri]